LVTIFGSAGSASTPGADVAIQRLVSGTWVTIANGTLSADRMYSVQVRAASGTYKYQAVIGGFNSPNLTVTGIYGRNITVPAAGAPFTVAGQLPTAVSADVKVQWSSNGTSNWTDRGHAPSSTSGFVGVRTYLGATSYIRMRAPSIPSWTPPAQKITLGTDPYIARILQDTNKYRASAGRPALKLLPSLNLVAGNWAYSMHQSSVPSDCSASFKHNPNYAGQYAPGWTRAAENISAGQTYTQVVPGWWNSPIHKANILGSYTHIGIGYYFGTKCYKRYYVQNFARY
jgi:uncharacterized protein YkwD